MASRPVASPKQRPKYYDLNLLNLPMPGLVSILHRITGVAMFLFLIPLVLLVLQTTLASDTGFATWQGYFANPLVKLIVIGFVWSFMHHLFAGIRYLLLDLHIGVAKVPAQSSARVVLVAGLVAATIFAARIW
ncbi:MAG: succinate dehydrogenase, cytochrome b556 subunit [Aeromicrobium sp.]|nr:succinate dehydrogenase, cytochrome b556 subunit [Burkholderiales bacterium]